MAESSPKGQNWIVLISATLSVVSALSVAYLSYQSKNKESDVRREEIAFEQSKFDFESKNKEMENLKIIIPKIVSNDEQTVKEGMTTLFVLFQSRAKGVLESVNSALTEQQRTALKDQLQPALARAQELEQRTDSWVIVIGGDKTINDAKAEIDRAQKAGYAGGLYFKDGWYRSAVGPFPTRTDADRANIAVSATLRSGAYVVNLKSWCPSPSPQDGFSKCAGS